MSSKTQIEVSNSEKKPGHTYVQWMVAIMAATTLLSYGLQGGWVSPMTVVLQSDQSPTDKPLTDSEISWVASSMSISAMFGVSLYAYIADAHGRKFAVLAIVIPQALCWIIKLMAGNVTTIIIARILAGIPAGGCFNVIPMYIKEISQDDIRGTMVSLSLVFQHVGLLAMYSMGGYLDYFTVLWITLGISLVNIVCMLFAPESPAYYVKRGKIEEAAKTLAFLRGLDTDDVTIEKEIQVMKNEEIYFQKVGRITLMTIIRNKAWRRGFILCMLLLTALDLNGQFTILTYTRKIIEEAGVHVKPELQALSIPIIMIVGSFISMSCVDKIGRKPLLVGSYIITTLGMTSLATMMLMQKNEVPVPSWAPVVALVTIVGSYATGMFPMTYIVLAEIFNFQVRARLIGFIVTYGWLVVFFQLVLYAPLSSLGLHTMFYMFAGVNVFGALVALILQPETKGKTVEEIEKLLLNRRF